MDRYEYNVRLEQIRSLAQNHEFHEALVIADGIDWRKVRSVRTLSLISEIYKVNRRYEEARDILLMADERCPNARSIIYALCELSIKMGDLNDSVGYLKEYMELAPQDPSTFILQYKFYDFTNVGIKQRIEILEQLKNIDYQERWGYELARLYSEDGDREKCVAECDRLILWFGHGKYVTEAMKLKMQYEDLTPAQQQKYDHQDGLEVLAGAEDITGSIDTGEKSEPLSIEITNIQPSNQPTNRIPDKEVNSRLGLDEIKEPSVNLDRYSTMNLQAELKKNMVDLEEKTGEPLREKEMPLPSMKAIVPMKADTDINEITADDAIPEQEPESPKQEAPAPETFIPKQETPAPRINAADDDVFANRPPLNLDNHRQTDAEKELAPIISEEYDGQMSLNVPSDPETAEKQITGQINIEDILNGWSRQKEQHDRRKLVEAKRRSLEQTNDIVNELVGVIPGVKEASLPEIPEETEPVNNGIRMESVEPEELPAEVTFEEEPEEPEEPEKTTEEGMKRETLTVTSDLTGLLREHRERVNARRKRNEPEESIPEDEDIEEPEDSDIPEPEEEEEPVVKKKPRGKKKEEYVAPEPQEVHGFDEEEKDIFAQFLPMHDLPDIIRDALNRMKLKGDRGNILITGNEQSARVNLANALARGYMHEHPDEFVGKVAKIPADLFNTKNVPDVLKALDGCALVIEHAADLNDASLEDIRSVLTKPDTSIILILEETKASFKILERNNKKEWFDDIFDVKIEIPTYTNDDLVFHGREYAKEQEYTIDDMGILALYTRIDERQTADHFVTIDEVEEIVDEAIRHVNRKTPGHFLDVVVGKRYDDDDMIIIREKDFI
ncbi:MAG: hypothetical protein K5668_07860 [Lachnospiraceae bacterium]|nr:hypothetical protein [Lachnospiraceae bacterium]